MSVFAAAAADRGGSGGRVFRGKLGLGGASLIPYWRTRLEPMT
jgi:hypothetical protein